jgi:hypothetical protein
LEPLIFEFFDDTLMRETDLLECETALRIINFFFEGELSFRKTLADLRGVIVLLGEHETGLSKVLRSKWRILEEINAYATYRKAPTVSGENQILIDATLEQMRAILFEAVGGVRRNGGEQDGPKPFGSRTILQRN